MRISPSMKEYLKSEIKRRLVSAEVYLFGSRADDSRKGGDIDLLVLSEQDVDFETKAKIKISFYKKFGEQKIDMVFYNQNDRSAFKELALMEAIKL
ncbi:MAG TPA: nucleotidyltransferase domain-containing protein [Candidatus Wallbacteria bacterium]|nr:nucleotidyltransferase domain-containing protein [Candidatus Wallbacteria bacterium]